MPCSARCSAGPMPLSMSSWGVLTAPPAEDHLAPRERVAGDAVDLDVHAGRARLGRPPIDGCLGERHTAHERSVTTRRLRRRFAGRRYASAVEARAPRRCETIVCEKPWPSGRFAT